MPFVAFDNGISPAAAEVEGVGAEFGVDGGLEADLGPTDGPEPIFYEVEELRTDAFAFEIGKDGDDPEFAGGSVADGETDDVAFDFAEPAFVGGLEHGENGVLVDAGEVEAVTRVGIFLYRGADVEECGDIRRGDFAECHWFFRIARCAGWRRERR